MKWPGKICLTLAAVATLFGAASPPAAKAEDKKPNIVVIMGDDIGMWNIGAYHRGLMAGKTPNLDKLAKEGMLFTDYYAEASCTAGRANFITGELPIRTGMTTVGQAGASVGLPAEAVTIATILKSMGYATGQFGKNPLAISITSMPWKTPRIPTIHRISWTSSARATWFIAGPPTRMTPLTCLAGAKSASRRLRTPVHSIPSAWKL
jgi:hypothetical protein